MGLSIVLLKEQSDSVLTFRWTAAEYNLSDLEKTNYSLEMAYADSSFSNSIELVNTDTTFYTTTVGALNTKIQNAFGAIPDSISKFKFRVFAYINTGSEYSDVYSTVSTVGYTPYSTIIYVPPIYMLGSATEAGWDNTLALEMTHLDGGKFSITATLTAGTDMFVKFISDLGAWAPQWGTDAHWN